MKIQEKLKQMINKVKAEVASNSGPNPEAKTKAEAEIIIRGPNGKIKSRHTATNTNITL